MDHSDEYAGGKLVHLEKLFLIAQFYARDADEAALLVDRVFKESNALGSPENEDLSSIVKRLVDLSRRHSVSAAGVQGIRIDAQPARAVEAKRFVDDRCRRRFIALTPDERLALWHAVESGTEANMLVESDALGSFVHSIERLLSPDERDVFGSFINRSTVSDSLRHYWNSVFVPVPPTLRSVVEAGERKAGIPVAASDASRFASKPAPASQPRRKKSGFRRSVLYSLVILAAAGIGYVLTRIGEPTPPSTDILQLSLSASDDVELTFRTDNAEQAERFIRDRFGWRLTLPQIEETSLEGISLVKILDSVELPVVVYTDNSDNSIVPVFTFSYSFLEANRERFGLARETLRQIQESAQFDIHEYRQSTAFVWRDQDDIFAAFVTGENPDLQSRISIRS